MRRCAVSWLTLALAVVPAAASAQPLPARPPATQTPLPVPSDPPPARSSRQMATPFAPLPGADADAMASAPRDFELLSLERLAQEISPNLREAVAAIESARGQAVQAGLYPNPIANWGSPQWTGSISQYYQFLSQEVVTARKLRLNRDVANRAVEQAEYQFVRTRFDLLTAVRAAFYQALADQRRVEIVRGLVEISRKSQESAVKLQAGGEGTRADVLLLDIELERARVALQNAQAYLDAAKRSLAAAVGDPRLAIAAVRGDLLDRLPDFEYELVRAGILDQNALVAIAQIEVARSQAVLRRARVEPIPNLFFQGGYQYQVEQPGRNQGLFQVSIPIPVFNRNQGNIRSARAAISRSAEALERLKNELSQQAADALGRYLAARQLVERFETQILPKARETQELAQRGYQQGQFDFLRLLASQRTLVEANLGYIDAQENRWTAAAEIASLLQLEEFPPPGAPGGDIPDASVGPSGLPSAPGAGQNAAPSRTLPAAPKEDRKEAPKEKKDA